MKDIWNCSLIMYRRFWVLLSLSVITPLGIWLWRYYDGPAKHWINYYISCVFYEIFWCLFLFFFWHRRENTTKIAISVFAATCFLEILQLWEAPFLVFIRATFIGKALIGTDFVWRQFPYYVIGSFLGWFWLRLLSRKSSLDN